MSWHEKYWDAVEQLYWAPSHLGLKSISKSKWIVDTEFIRIPKGEVKPGRSIYTRIKTFKDNAARMRSLEETLNHIFNITFAIAPDPIISKLLHQQIGFDDNGPFERFGREIAERYGWGDSNVTQPDGFFVSDASILSVELKLGSPSWPQQVLKYLVLTCFEEQRTGPRGQVGILFITPEKQPDRLWQQVAAANGTLAPDYLNQFDPAKLKSPVLRKAVEGNRAHLEGLLQRFALRHTSWAELLASCQAVVAGLNRGNIGDETLARLLGGFIAAVQAHRGPKCEQPKACSE